MFCNSISCGSFEKDLSNIAKWSRCWQTTWTDLFVILMGPFSYCLKRQTGELIPVSRKTDEGHSKNYDDICGVQALKVLSRIQIAQQKFMSCANVVLP